MGFLTLDCDSTRIKNGSIGPKSHESITARHCMNVTVSAIPEILRVLIGISFLIK